VQGRQPVTNKVELTCQPIVPCSDAIVAVLQALGSTGRVSDEGAPEDLGPTVVCFQDETLPSCYLFLSHPSDSSAQRLECSFSRVFSHLLMTQPRVDTVLFHPRNHSKAKFRGDYCEA
jgi:hypothetical protein